MHDMTPEQSRMGRAALNWTIDKLSHETGVSRNTIARLEKGDKVNQSTNNVIRLALENAGVLFIDENGEGPGVRLRKS